MFDCGSSNDTQTEEIVHHRVQFDTSFPAKFVLVDVESEEKRHPIKKLNITTIDFHPIICGTRNYHYENLPMQYTLKESYEATSQTHFFSKRYSEIACFVVSRCVFQMTSVAKFSEIIFIL